MLSRLTYIRPQICGKVLPLLCGVAGEHDRRWYSVGIERSRRKERNENSVATPQHGASISFVPGSFQTPVRLEDRVRNLARLKHFSLRTEEAYWGWIRRFIIFHGKRHPDAMGEKETSQFLSHLAVDGRVAASTQNQAP